MKNILGFVIVCFCIAACEEPVNRSLSNADSDLIVVEGMLTNEKTNHLIKISHPYKTQNEIAMAVSGATVTITDEADIYILVESPVGSGKYFTPEIRAVAGRLYELLIVYNNKEYTAKDSAVPVEPLQSLQYEKVDNGYSLIFNNTGQDPNYIDHNLNWHNTPLCDTETTCEGRVVFYDLKTIDVNEIYKPDKEDFSFPLNTVVIRRKYSVSAAYKNFLRSMLSETEWRGGVFDVQRDNVQTNLSKGATGFFAVTTVVADTTTIKALP